VPSVALGQQCATWPGAWVVGEQTGVLLGWAGASGYAVSRLWAGPSRRMSAYLQRRPGAGDRRGWIRALYALMQPGALAPGL
jgi:hypothetical protein